MDNKEGAAEMLEYRGYLKGKSIKKII